MQDRGTGRLPQPNGVDGIEAVGCCEALRDWGKVLEDVDLETSRGRRTRAGARAEPRNLFVRGGGS